MEDQTGGGSSDDAPSCPRGHWRPAEDDKLRQLVARYGPQNWNSIAEKLQGRSGKSCRLRWFNQLDPRINRKPFAEKEEERLLAAHRIHGNKWAHISRLFPGRTDNAVKNHWHVIMARKQREQSKLCGTKRTSCPDVISTSTAHVQYCPNSNSSKTCSSTNTHFLEFQNPKTSWNFKTSTSMDCTDCVNFSSSNKNIRASSSNKSSLDHQYHLSPSSNGSTSFRDFGSYPVSGNYKMLHSYKHGDHESSRHGNGMMKRVSLSNTWRTIGNVRATSHQQVREDESIGRQKEIPFIDFLGVESLNS